MIDGIVLPLLKILVVLNATLVDVTYMVLLERKVIAWAQSRKEGDADALVEGLFRANFIEGRYVGNVDELVAIAVAAGYDPADARAFLESDDLTEIVAQSDQRAREMGIGGVPFFIFDGKTAVSGAQEPATIVQAIAQARAGEVQ